MVTRADEPPHFMALGKVPVVDIATPLGRVYELVGRQQVGGVIMRRRARPAYYVTAQFLEHAARKIAAEKGFKAAAKTPMSQYLEDFKASVPPIESVEATQDVVHRYPIEVARRPVQRDSNVDKQLKGGPRIYSVMQAGRQTGWLFNHEWVAGTVGLKPPVWMCTNPEKQHINYDFDHGHCSYCRYSLEP